MTSVSIALIVFGIVFLCYALKPTSAICNNVESQRSGWQSLYALIIFFIGGYLLFVNYLVNNQSSGIIEFIVASVFFAGAIFVALVTNLSLASILSLNQASHDVQHQADTDRLTQLSNRQVFNQLIASMERKTEPEQYSLILINLNKFKLINELSGHKTGDLLLIEVARRLNKHINHHVSVYRLGSDEFVMVARGYGHEKLSQLAQATYDEIKQPFTLEKQQITIDLSVGIASFPGEGDGGLTLLKQADLALNHSRNNQLNFVFYNKELARKLSEFNDKLHHLERAILTSELFLCYQPIIDSKTRRVVSVEALARWTMKNGIEVSPAEFIPLAQSNNLIHSISSFVLDEALDQLARWHRLGQMITINVNLSASDFQDIFLARRLIRLLAHHNIMPGYLTLEITESVLIKNIEQARSNINQLRDAGVNIALDDFGTGFSSLNYLRLLNINQLKLDYSFTKNILSHEKDLAIMQSTIKLAHKLGCTVTAEGIENELLDKKLTELGSDRLQGHWLSEPLSHEQTTQYILATGIEDKIKNPVLHHH